MTEQGRKYLSDIRASIGLITEFIKATPDFGTYTSDAKTRSATERQLAIIGEALNKLSKTEPSVSLDNIPQIVAFRNRLVHGYDSIDDAMVWAILKNHLPKLKTEIDLLWNT